MKNQAFDRQEDARTAVFLTAQLRRFLFLLAVAGFLAGFLHVLSKTQTQPRAAGKSRFTSRPVQRFPLVAGRVASQPSALKDPIDLSAEWSVRVRAVLAGGAHLAGSSGPDEQPVLLGEENSARAVALDTLTWGAEPFPMNQSVPFGPTPTPGPCTRTNVALSNGSTATASSTHPSNRFPASAVINGDHTGAAWRSINGGLERSLFNYLVQSV